MWPHTSKTNTKLRLVFSLQDSPRTTVRAAQETRYVGTVEWQGLYVYLETVVCTNVDIWESLSHVVTPTSIVHMAPSASLFCPSFNYASSLLHFNPLSLHSYLLPIFRSHFNIFSFTFLSLSPYSLPTPHSPHLPQTSSVLIQPCCL